MIFVEVHSGMGNQMFQYAFGYAAAKKMHTRLFVWQDRPEQPCALVRYFKLPFFDMRFWLQNKYFSLIFRKMKNRVRSNSSIVDNNAFKAYEVPLKNFTYYGGYFQSINFFENHVREIRKCFRIRSEYRRMFQKQYGELFQRKKTLVLHIRRTDYLYCGIEQFCGGNDMSLPAEYYKNCLNKFNLSDYQVIFVGDDLEWARLEFADVEGVMFEHNQEAIIDFQLQLNSDVLVMSNGTFSWWAGFLNEKPNKLVLAPKDFIGYKTNILYPQGIEYKTYFDWVK